MSTAIHRFRGSVSRLQQHFAGPHVTATLRRHGPGLTHRRTGKPVTLLYVNGTVAAGGSSLDLDLGSIRGELGIGWQFTIAGDATTYEATNTVTVSTDQLSGVEITPVLAAEATDDARVTITRAYGEWTYPAFRRGFREELVDGEIIQADDWQLIVVPVSGQPESFEPGDTLLFDSATVSIVRELPIQPGSVAGAMRFHCRG